MPYLMIGIKRLTFLSTILFIFASSFLVTGCTQPETSSMVPMPPQASGPDQNSELIVAYNILSEGELVHNIPHTAKIMESFVVEAGLAEEVTESVLNQLEIDGQVTIEQEIYYLPLGVELTLKSDKESAFEIQNISSGRKVVITDYPGKWMWLVKPIKSGEYTLSIQSTISLLDNENLNEEKYNISSQVIDVESSRKEDLQLLISNSWVYILAFPTLLTFTYLGWKLGHLIGIDSRRYFKKK